MFNHITTVAKRKANIPGWEPFKYQAIDEGTLVEGAVPIGKYARGPLKGHFKWDRKAPTKIVLVTMQEQKDEERRYEKETGKCYACYGEGRELKRWSKKEGYEYRPCRRCNGTGAKP